MSPRNHEAMTRSRIWQRLPALSGLLSGYARVIAAAPEARRASQLIPVTASPVPAAVPPRRRGHSFDCE